MQTFKTAVIVVLIGTVVWGVCVSLTTPPAELPEDIIVAINETDSAFPDGTDSTLDALGIDPGLPDALGTGAPPHHHHHEEGHHHHEEGLHHDEDGGVIGSFSDSTTATGDKPTQVAGDNRLPRPPVGVEPPVIESGRTYESTGQDRFQLPDPSSLAPSVATQEDAGQATPTDSDPAADARLDLAMTAPANTDSADASAAGGGYQFPNMQAGSDAAAGDALTLPGDTADAGEMADAPSSTNVGLANAILAADGHVEADRMKEALTTLSLFYNAPDLTDTEREQLLSRLDPLAGEVIYSRLHLLEQPYRVGKNETLMEIAAKYEVPWQLLANINGIEDPVVVMPGTELKVVRGPFRAEVNLQSAELTLMLGELYAGRFPITLGSDPAPQPGTYTVRDKQVGKTYRDANGNSIAAGDPQNPFGNVWLDLGQQMCIHGGAAAAMGKGCIALEPADAEDVYGILSQGSTISIRR